MPTDPILSTPNTSAAAEPQDPRTAAWVEQQRRFYASRPHAHLQYSPKSVYADRLVSHVLRVAHIQPGSRVLEVGCGAGRFTLPLLRRFQGLLTGFDLSQELLDSLRDHLTSEPLPPGNTCDLVAGDIYAMNQIFPAQSFDHVIGFFFLHHLPVPELGSALAQVRRVLRPGGRVVFVEPNRRNPLFLLQVMCCADMTWADEKGMFTLGTRLLRDSFRFAGLRAPTIETVGCFPPQIIDRWQAMVSVENRIEKMSLLKPILPFRVIWSEVA